ncbi:unnamed protein product [Brassicogethes aeneus]|uniref:Uncharacterized protein n=1 Tax=Brassicogethes aeneus TaxID=1431903 RepID=A0A9P0AZ33_BRAAE|nr:unnamed protein product [Brassicogethes aeneus]
MHLNLRVLLALLLLTSGGRKNNDLRCHLQSLWLGLIQENMTLTIVMPSILNGPDIRKLLKDDSFSEILSEPALNAWESVRAVIKNVDISSKVVFITNKLSDNMLAIFALAFLALATAGPLKDDPAEVTAAKIFINECIEKVLIDGLPEANIPSHEPLVFHDDNIQIDILGGMGSLELYDMILEGVPEFELREVVSHPENNPNGVFFDYTIYWKSMVLKSKYYLGLSLATLGEGEQSITMNHVTFSGTWNMTNAEGLKQSLDAFTLNVETKSVDVVVTNTPFNVLWKLAGHAMKNVMNSPAVSQVLSKGLLEKFNVDWMQKGERIDAMLNYCWPKN